jgi:hypothetical protein
MEWRNEEFDLETLGLHAGSGQQRRTVTERTAAVV